MTPTASMAYVPSVLSIQVGVEETTTEPEEVVGVDSESDDVTSMEETVNKESSIRIVHMSVSTLDLMVKLILVK